MRQIVKKMHLIRFTTLFNRACLYLLAGFLAAGSLSTAQAQALVPGTVVGWGDNVNGMSTPPAGLKDVIAITAGDYHNLALKSDGTVVAWGGNYNGETIPPAGLKDVITIAAGDSHSLALKSDGSVVGWGYNGYGESAPPAGLNGVIAIAAGYIHSLALKSDGTVVGWGDNFYGESTPPAGLKNVIAIAARFKHSLALKSDGTVVGWGENDYGETAPPVGLNGVIAIAAGSRHSLALKSDGTVVGWGDNFYGESTPPAGLKNVIAIAAGFKHSLALKSDGTVVAWGYNLVGETAVPAGLTGVTAIAAGTFYSLAANTAPKTQPFAAFAPYLTIGKGSLPNTDGFGFGATLTLDAKGAAFDPSKNPVSLQLGSSSAVTIPAGSFKPNGFGGLMYIGKIGTVSVGATLQPQGAGKYLAGFGATGANLTGVANPVAVTLTIGGNQGKASVTAYIAAAKATSGSMLLTSPFGK